MLRLCSTGVLMCLFAVGCVPDPEINVPDFAPIGMVNDAGMDMAKMQPDLAMQPTMSWKAETSGSMSILRSVWIADANLTVAYAVGQDGTILRRSGGMWTKEMSGTDKNLYAVVGLPQDEAYAVGADATILHLKAGKWTAEVTEPIITASLYGLTRTQEGDLFAVGDGGTIVHLKDGKWKTETPPMVVDLRGVYGTKVEEVYAAGQQSVIRRDALGLWKPDTATMPIGMGNFLAVTGAGTNVYVSGEFGRVLHREATQWVVEATIPPGMGERRLDFFGIYATGSEVWAVGTDGRVQHRTQAMKWESEKSGVTGDLYGVTGAGTTTILSVGVDGAVIKRF